MPSIIITGANGGLGLAVTKQLSADGFRIHAVTGKAGAGQVPAGAGISVAEVDLLEEKSALNYVSGILEEDPEIHAAVLLVGGFAMGGLAETSRTDLEKMIDLNFFSAYNIARPLLKHFQDRGGGRIILVGSRPGLEAASGKDFFAYSLSKSMVFKLAEFINAEGKEKNVDAMVIVPSVIDTEANRKAMPGADFSKWVPPSAIADTIAFYLTPVGRMIREGIIKLYNRS